MATAERIVVRLDDAFDFEREFKKAYRQMPRSRRQEWIRLVLQAGFRFLNDPAAQPPLGPQPANRPAPTAPPEAEAAGCPSASRQEASLQPAEAARREPGQIKGFFGDQ